MGRWRAEEKNENLECVYKKLICNSVFAETFLVCLVAKTKLETCKVHKYHLQLKKKTKPVKFKQNDVCECALKSAGCYSNRRDCCPWPNTLHGYLLDQRPHGLHKGSPGYKSRQ